MLEYWRSYLTTNVTPCQEMNRTIFLAWFVCRSRIYHLATLFLWLVSYYCSNAFLLPSIFQCSYDCRLSFFAQCKHFIFSFPHRQSCGQFIWKEWDFNIYFGVFPEMLSKRIVHGMIWQRRWIFSNKLYAHCMWEFFLVMQIFKCWLYCLLTYISSAIFLVSNEWLFSCFTQCQWLKQLRSRYFVII